MIELINFSQNLQDQHEIHAQMPKIHQKMQSYKFIKDLNSKIFKHPIQSCSLDFCTSSLQIQNKKSQQQKCTPNPQKKTNCVKRRKKLTIQKKITQSPLNGQGVIKLNNGEVVFATWTNDQVQGDAKIVYPSGNIYVGQVQNYKKHGKGLLLFTNGETYDGNFINGSFQGFGVLKNFLGEVIKKGKWRNGNLNLKDQIW